MRTYSIGSYAIVVSNDEYAMIRTIKSKGGSMKESDMSEFQVGLSDALQRRGALEYNSDLGIYKIKRN